MSIGKSKEGKDKAYDNQSVIQLMKEFKQVLDNTLFVQYKLPNLLKLRCCRCFEQIADIIRKMKSRSHILGTVEVEWQNLAIVIKRMNSQVH